MLRTRSPAMLMAVVIAPCLAHTENRPGVPSGSAASQHSSETIEARNDFALSRASYRRTQSLFQSRRRACASPCQSKAGVGRVRGRTSGCVLLLALALYGDLAHLANLATAAYAEFRLRLLSGSRASLSIGVGGAVPSIWNR